MFRAAEQQVRELRVVRLAGGPAQLDSIINKNVETMKNIDGSQPTNRPIMMCVTMTTPFHLTHVCQLFQNFTEKKRTRILAEFEVNLIIIIPCLAMGSSIVCLLRS